MGVDLGKPNSMPEGAVKVKDASGAAAGKKDGKCVSAVDFQGGVVTLKIKNIIHTAPRCIPAAAKNIGREVWV